MLMLKFWTWKWNKSTQSIPAEKSGCFFSAYKVTHTVRKWLNGWVNKIDDVKSVFWELMFSQLALVEVINKQTNGTVQSIRTTWKTSRRTSEPRQIMSKFSIVAFNWIGVCFAFRNGITTPVIPQRSIYIEGITEIPVGFGRMVYDGLHKRLRTFPSHFPT